MNIVKKTKAVVVYVLLAQAWAPAYNSIVKYKILLARTNFYPGLFSGTINCSQSTH
jgi:hypothetical protein